VAIKRGLQDRLPLGDMSASRDWGYAPDYVRGMWMALNHSTAEDFVFATGTLHTVRDVVEVAFRTVGLDPASYVSTEARMLRPVESVNLVGNAGKAARLLGWKPEVQFEEIIAKMTEAEMKLPPA